MAWSSSTNGVFAYSVLSNMNQTTGSVFQVPTTASGTAFKCALWGNSNTPDKTVTTLATASYNGASSQWVSATYEVTGTAYTVGGTALLNAVATQSTNVWSFGAYATSWTSASFSAYGALVYSTVTNNPALCFNSFGGSVQTVTSGTFTIAWNSTATSSVTGAICTITT